ncbi:hypothetical protein ACHWQZ_G005882 [Mnemiopsis leidyi]
MPTFSKFITSQRGAQQILDSDGYIYSRKKSSDTALTSTWRCAKYNPPTKCKCHIYLALEDNSLTLAGDKKGDTYSSVLNVMKFFFDQHCPVDSGSVMIDFERAVMNAFRDSLPGWKVSNCFFHFCQSVQKNINKRFKVQYFSDKVFGRAARLPVFLAFIPVSDIEEVFYEITFYIQSNYPQLMVVVNYFEKTYLGSVTVDSEVRVTPAFPSDFWNHFDRVLEDPDFPRTSNMVEGFHRGFKTRVNRPKPSVQEYVRAVKEEQVMTDFHLDRLSVGKTPSKRRRTCHTHLHDICSFYSTYPSKIDYVLQVLWQ